MAKHKNISIICLLVVGLVTSATPAKSASVLVQEGVYAEEIEGDLDAAIRIYEQVIAQAEAAEQTAAQATFRIAMCHLKKAKNKKPPNTFKASSLNFHSRIHL